MSRDLRVQLIAGVILLLSLFFSGAMATQIAVQRALARVIGVRPQ